MKYTTIQDKEKKGVFSIFSSEDFEYVNPVRYYLESAIMSYYNNETTKIGLLFPNVSLTKAFDEIIQCKSILFANKVMQEIISTTLPNQLFKLLHSTDKDEQEKLLRGITLTPMELTAFYCNAYAKYGYSLSHYSANYNPKGIEKDNLPRFAFKDDDGKIISSGKTPLSDGQIKNIIEQRNVTVSKFLDNGKDWHCFFFTFKGVTGKERGNNPHLHYISHTWGLTREQVLGQLQSRRYSFRPVPHISYYTER